MPAYLLIQLIHCCITAPGCKRVVFDSGYLASLSRPNVKVVYESIERVIPEGIKLRNGETIPLDVIVFATGFDTVCRVALQYRVTSTQGIQTQRERWGRR
jgi:cation diffusion facilitator CzcD-associated flavoprotein CzcO